MFHLNRSSSNGTCSIQCLPNSTFLDVNCFFMLYVVFSKLTTTCNATVWVQIVQKKVNIVHS